MGLGVGGVGRRLFSTQEYADSLKITTFENPVFDYSPNLGRNFVKTFFTDIHSPCYF